MTPLLRRGTSGYNPPVSPTPPVDDMRTRLYAMDLSLEQVAWLGAQVAANPPGHRGRITAAARLYHDPLPPLPSLPHPLDAASAPRPGLGAM